MKERVLVKYQYQNDPHDKTFNCFFITKDSETPLRVIDLLAEFPGLRVREFGAKGFHFRFLDKLGKMLCWVDIKVLSAHVPINKGVIDMKVLLMPDQGRSTIFDHLEKDLHAREARVIKEQQAQRNTEQRRPAPMHPPQHNSTNRPHDNHSQKHVHSKTADISPGHRQPVSHIPQANPTLMNEFELDFERPFIDPPQPGRRPAAQQSTQQQDRQPKVQPQQGVEADILGFDEPVQVSTPVDTPVSAQDDGKSEAQKMMEMFGDDFDPNAENRVYEVMKIRDRQKELADQNTKNIERRNKEMLEMQDAKLEAGHALEPKIKAWAFASNGSKNNIRIILTTLDQVVWENSGWETVTMADLVSDSSVKKVYMKAVKKFHTDHNSDVKDPAVLYLMERIFNVVNDAYNEFTKQKK
jgi:hypothetical protein